MATTSKIPDVNGIINSISDSQDVQEVQEETPKELPKHPDIITDDKPKEGLWNEFRSFLHEDPPIVGRKPYYIDNDLIDTLNQCDFGAPNTTVLNAIVRAFLVANVDHLKNIEKKKLYPTILEKYAKTAVDKTGD